MPEYHKIVVVGAGQGGLGISYYLTKFNLPHIVVDKGDIANSWKEKRWDSFCLVTPNWTLNFPGHPYKGIDPNGFMKRDEFVEYISNWAKSFNAPIRKNINIKSIKIQNSKFLLETNDKELLSDVVVIATSTHQLPNIPNVSKKIPKSIKSIHVESYKNPLKLDGGEVLVVGSGQSGCQVVEDLISEGRKVHLCVGKSGRLPRSYRGKDCITWQKEMNLLDRTPDMLEKPSLRFAGDPHLSGRDGGKTLSLHKFHRNGVNLYGRLIDVSGNEFIFDDNLFSDIACSDNYAKEFRKRIDDYINISKLNVPSPSYEDFDGEEIKDDKVIKTKRSLDFIKNKIKTIIWATGFIYDFSWINCPITDEMGYPKTNQGATNTKGLYFNGLNWMTKRKSGILYGFDEDSISVATQIKNYLKNIINTKNMNAGDYKCM